MKVETPKELIRYRKSFTDRLGNDQYVAYLEWFSALDLFEEHVGENYDYEVELLPSRDEDIVIARATITVRRENDSFRRQGIGIGIVIRPEAQYKEMAIKAAEHDALKRALLKFGVGRDLYQFELTNQPEPHLIGRSVENKTAVKKSVKAVKASNVKTDKLIFDLSADSDEVREIVETLFANRIAFKASDLNKLRMIEAEDFDTFTTLYDLVQNKDWRQFFQVFHSV